MGTPSTPQHEAAERLLDDMIVPRRRRFERPTRAERWRQKLYVIKKLIFRFYAAFLIQATIMRA